MDCSLYCFFYNSCYWRLASIGISALVLLCPVSQQLFCAPIEPDSSRIIETVLCCSVNQDEKAVLGQINRLEQTIQCSQDPYIVGLNFLESLVEGLNRMYNLHLTVAGAYQLIYEHIDKLGLSGQDKDTVLLALELFKPQGENLPLLLTSEGSTQQTASRSPCMIYPVLEYYFCNRSSKK